MLKHVINLSNRIFTGKNISIEKYKVCDKEDYKLLFNNQDKCSHINLYQRSRSFYILECLRVKKNFKNRQNPKDANKIKFNKAFPMKTFKNIYTIDILK